MSNTYTPGPWKQGSTNPNNVSAGDALVCRTFSRGKYSNEDNANAILIAHAPEMLQTLVELTDYFNDISTDSYYYQATAALLEKAEQLIKSAQGIK